MGSAATVLRRRRAASIAGYARVEKADPDEIAAARRRGGETRAQQLRGRPEHGRMMAEAKRLKRYGPASGGRTEQKITELERRLAALEGKKLPGLGAIPEPGNDLEDRDDARDRSPKV